MNFLSLRSPLILALLATICLVLIGATATVVPETRQAVVLRFGKVVDIYNPYRAREVFGQTGAGLKLRAPVIDRIVWIDKRIQSLALTNQQLRSADQLPLQVDAVALYRIADPERFYVTAGSQEGLANALGPLFGHSLRTELGKRTFVSLLSPESGTAIAELRAELNSAAHRYGAEVIDVQITRNALPDGSPLQTALQRMTTVRLDEAQSIRAESDMQVMAITAQANADAARTYQESFGRDSQFYDFYRAMQSYRTVFDPKAGHETNMVLSPDNDYLRQFRGR